jgi:predicted DNA-binding mobile mystery protein A
MTTQRLQLSQLKVKLQSFDPCSKIAVPPTGWIKAVRLALGMSLQQLASRMNMTKQSIHDLETREAEGTVTLGTLRNAARALDMELVYGFVPKDGSVDALIDRKARELATKIVLRTSASMALEDQQNSELRIRKAIDERAAQLKHDMPKILWD